MREKVFSSLIWTYGERILAQLITLVVTIVLARILSPQENGIISLVLVFITLANVVVSDGFGNALIQNKNADDTDFSSMLVFSVFCGIALYFLLFLCSPLIAAYYQLPELVLIIRVFAIKLPIASINSIQQAFVAKRMEFKKFFYATLTGTLVSGIVGITMAYMGFGVWALVMQYLTNSAIDTVFLAFTIGWKPKLVFEWSRVRKMLGFANRILAVSMMMALYSNIRDLIIGKKYSIEDLSYSNKGQQFPALISVNVNTSITKVLFPAISEVQDDKARVKAMTRRAIKVGTFLLSPLLIGLAAVGPSFVSVLLTDKWLPCVPYLRIMCIVYLLQPIQTASLQAMKALGESKLYLKLEIIRWCTGIAVLIAAVLFFDSVFSVVLSALFAEIASTIINWPANKRLLGYSYSEQLNDVVLPLFAAGIMFIVVVVENCLTMPNVILLIIQIITGAAVYLLACKLMRIDSFDYSINILKNLFVSLKGTKAQ